MDQKEDTHYLSDKSFEVSRVIFLLIISSLLGLSAYVWQSTIKSFEAQLAYERSYISSLEERVRLAEIANEKQSNAIAYLGSRLDTQRDHIRQLDELYYGPYRRK